MTYFHICEAQFGNYKAQEVFPLCETYPGKCPPTSQILGCCNKYLCHHDHLLKLCVRVLMWKHQMSVLSFTASLVQSHDFLVVYNNWTWINRSCVNVLLSVNRNLQICYFVWELQQRYEFHRQYSCLIFEIEDDMSWLQVVTRCEELLVY